MPMITRSELFLAGQPQSHYDTFESKYKIGRLGKEHRPWFILDMTKKFPEDTALIGFEIETGCETQDELHQACEWLWDNTMHTTVDPEGISPCPLEVTFPPMPAHGDSPELQQLLNFIRHAPTLNLKTKGITSRTSSGGSVGFHANVSTPYLRSCTPEEIIHRRNYFVRKFEDMYERGLYFFVAGRQPYTTVTAYAPDPQNASTRRIEFKLFHTTFHETQVDNYLRVTRRLAELCQREDADLPASTEDFFRYIMQDVENMTVVPSDNTQYAMSIRSWRPSI